MQYGRIWVTPHFYCQHLHCIHFLVLSKQAKTHFVLLINLAVEDLLIGFTEPVAIGTVGIPQRFGQEFYGNVSTAFQPQFFSLLAVNGIVDFIHWIVAYCCILASCLLTIRVTYLIVRRKRNTCRRYPTMVKNHCENRPNGGKHSTKLPRTLFIMIAVSLGQSVASKHRNFFCSQLLCHRCVPIPLIYASTVLHLANSLVNPVIYSFRLPIVREAVGKLKLKKQSKEYEISGQSWNFIIFYNYFRLSKMNNNKMPVMIVYLKNKRVCLEFVQFYIIFTSTYTLLSIKLEFLCALKAEEDLKS